MKQGPLRDSGLSDSDARGKRLRLLKEEITRATRQAKDRLPTDGDLERRWLREMEGLGLTAPTSNTKTFVVMGKTFDPSKPAEYLASFPIRRS